MSENQNSTTTFHRDANINIAAPVARTDNLSVFKSMSDPAGDRTVKQFLSLPVQISSGSFATSDTITTQVYSSDINAIYNNTVWYNKMQGMFGVRFDLHLRLTINANRYQQGRYLLCYLPYGGSDNGVGAWDGMHCFTLMQRTQLPHVEIDVSCDTEVEMLIPYQSCVPFLPIRSSPSGWSLGRIFIMPYSPLVAPTGSASCGYALFASLLNVTFQGAAVPQMANVTEEEQNASNIGPVTQGLRTVHRVAKIISGVPVPGLAAVANTAVWASDIASRVANTFGWSKPIIVSPHTRVLRNIFQGWNNADVPDASQPIALLASNSTKVQDDAFASGIDEMQISYIATKFSWFTTLTSWTTSVATGTNLISMPWHPFNFVSNVSDSGRSVNNYPPVSFCALFFSYWRGGMRLRIKAVKTEFHSGRLLIAFQPFDSTFVNNPGACSIQNTVYLERDILDLRYASEIELTIPYMSILPYKPTKSVISPGDTSNATGLLNIYVLDPLTAPSSVSTTVPLLLEIAGAPDIEFAFPTQVPCVPYLPSAIQMANLQEECEITTKPIGAMREGPITTTFAEHCIGEQVLSFRQLLKSTNYIPFSVNPAVEPTVLICPYTWEAYDNSTGTPAMNPSVLSDMYTLLSSVYCCYSGGVRIKLLSNIATVGKWIAWPWLGEAGFAGGTYGLGLYTSLTNTATNLFPLKTWNGLVIQSNPLTCGGIEIAVPQYNYTNLRCTCDNVAGANYNQVLGGSKSSTLISVVVQMSDSLAPAVARSGMDDANFYGFVSIPPMFFVTTNATNGFQ